jgi:hypothetical protein
MPKKSIAADELIFMFREELAPLYERAYPPSVAIVPDATHGWAALTSNKDVRRHPRLSKQITKIQAELRQRYRLKDS